LIEILPGDLSRPEMRQRMLDGPYNFFGLSFAGYRMDAYRRLPERWSPAPPDVWTDLFMWRKFLAMNGMKFGTRAAVTALHFAAPERVNATLEERHSENRRFQGRIRDPITRNDMLESAWHSLLNRTLDAKSTATALDSELSRMQLEINAIQKEMALVATSRDQLQEQLGHVAKSKERLEAEVKFLSECRNELQEQLKRVAKSKEGLEAGVRDLRESRENLKAKLRSLRQRLASKEDEVKLILGSKSWRLTAPLRFLSAKVTVRGHQSCKGRSKK
jgi:archaellum component FlaC